MDNYTVVNAPVDDAPKDRLILLGFKTARDRILPYRVKMACVYQWGDKSVLLMMQGHEPQFTLNKFMTISQNLQGITIGFRFPVTWYIRKALWGADYARGFNHTVYVYGDAKSWQKSPL